ncbi:MAG: hypothetical protein A2Y38_04590 [Spirochaetes bacterium GWB1_59_5]|nr:MAG: hypothetical protein A2Y38_04590 [Spirochaetes bacterium GWB1_59_5]
MREIGPAAQFPRVGAFRKGALSIICTVDVMPNGAPWGHVSVAHPRRYPTWDEIADIKDVFLGPDTTAVHVVPKASEHVNLHPNCFHLWACLNGPTLTCDDEVLG